MIKQWLTEQELIELLPLMESSDVYHLCKQSQASSKVLIESLKYIDEIDARYVFRHNKFPSREIVKWAEKYLSDLKDTSFYFSDLEYEAFLENIKAMLGNPNCPAKVLEMCFNLGEKDFDYRIARHKNISSKLFNLIISIDRIDLLENLSRNEGLSKAQVNALIALPFPKIHKILLDNPIVEEGAFQKASKSAAPSADDVRQRVKDAKGKRLSKSRFREFSRDTDVSVRMALSANTELPTDIIDNWVTHEKELDVLLSLYECQYLSKKAEHSIWMELKQYEYGFGKSDLTQKQSEAVDEFLEDYKNSIIWGD